MKTPSFITRMVICLLLVACLGTNVEAQNKRVLFYEVGTQNSMAIEDKYSEFAEELRNRHYGVASLTKDKLTRQKLQGYDLLVIQNINKNLDIGEISAILTFSIQDGGGVFINGVGTQTNQLTVPFGVSVDDGLLIDDTDPIPDEEKNTFFQIRRFSEDTTKKTLIEGLNKLGFYEGHGLKITGNADCIASGDEDTNSDTQSFQIGDKPCIATATRFGRGLIFINSEVEMFSDDHIDDFDNRRFGLNIMDWLQIRIEQNGTNPDDCAILIGELKLQNTRLEQENERLEQEKASLLGSVNSLTDQASICQTDLVECEEGTIGPFSPTNWAIIIAAVLILLAAIIYSKRKTRKGAEGEDVEELEGDLGYELDDGESIEGESDLDLKDVLESEMLDED